ncbi:MAG: hypothetical protein O7D34_03150, partial [Ignavibacteria bacterium]|nr:hypothetical protein [Ignavibacteria bacterium]
TEDGIDKNRAPRPSRDEAVESTPVSLLADDLGYKMGDDYLLFVRKGPTLKIKGKKVETLAIVSPEGRYQVSKNNKLSPAAKQGFASRYKGKDVADLETEVEEIQKKKKARK